jgi:hypothetical protein
MIIILCLKKDREMWGDLAVDEINLEASKRRNGFAELIP